ncbi:MULTISPECIES: VOC family protein [unclassified Novosphingobium]|uniref:VOC family protein n=1 Tax=unclassified Novosphingobium TaxID=2644732 RepID=UPI00135A921C|nr:MULTISPECIES: VOC family protein [unclassified Novosphingobium]
MSRLYGNAIQAGYLVEALEPAIAFWTGTLGIGPFFVMPPPQFAWLRHGGQDAARTDIIGQVALAQSGDIQIELIVPGPAPSTYRDFLGSGRSGMHHLGMASDRFDEQREAAIASGMTVATEGASQRTRFAYLQPPPGAPGPIIELIDMVPVMTEIYERMRAASQGWDGRDPMRAY